MEKSTLLKDFKAFALKGNVIDMAVGVIIGGAFGKIVSSLVADVIMPPIGLPADWRGELYGPEVGDEACRGGRWQGSGCRRDVELRQLPASNLRFPHHRFLHLYVCQAHHATYHPQEGRETCGSSRTARAQPRGGAADRDPRFAQEQVRKRCFFVLSAPKF